MTDLANYTESWYTLKVPCRLLCSVVVLCPLPYFLNSCDHVILTSRIHLGLEFSVCYWLLWSKTSVSQIHSLPARLTHVEVVACIQGCFCVLENINSDVKLKYHRDIFWLRKINWRVWHHWVLFPFWYFWKAKYLVISNPYAFFGRQEPWQSLTLSNSPALSQTNPCRDAAFVVVAV